MSTQPVSTIQRAYRAAMQRRSLGLIRDLGSGPYLDTFFVFGVGTVIVTRAYLWLTGYPQVGGSKLHIAHVLWGGLGMMVAIVVLLANVDRRARIVSAVLGGIGFGLFIDEIGKFITQDVDYFFKPAIALIYLIFVLMFFAIRALQRSVRPSPEVALANALAIVTESPARALTTAERDRANEYLELAADLPLSAAVRELVAAAATRAPRGSYPGKTLVDWNLRWYRRLGQSRLFIWAIAIYAAVNLIGLLILVLALLAAAGGRLGLPVTIDLTTDAQTATNGISAIAIIIGDTLFGIGMFLGLIALRRSQARALMWFDRAFLFQILFTQVFVFAEQQLLGLFGLVVHLFLWGAIRIAREDLDRKRSIEPSALDK
ncbi:MAG: hypothetical protein ACOYN3_06675 [Acidimicrobiia bacterium]